MRGVMERSASSSTPVSDAVATTTAVQAKPTALEQLDKEQIRKAVEVLFAHSRSRKSSTELLLNENENVFLMVILWKIPAKELRVRMSLPHSILSDSSEVCLFTKDDCESPEQTEGFYKKLLKKHGVNSVSQIIPFKTLKTEYKAYEAKLRLLGSFDIFITDERIRRHLPTHIGRHFYHRKKVPVPVNLLAKNLSKEITDRRITGTVLNISKHGSCSTIRIGHTGMETQHIIENILAVSEMLSEKLPEKWQSVKLLFLKTETSVSLPIFSSFVTSQDENSGSFRSMRKKELKKKRKHEKEKLKKKNKMLRKKSKEAAFLSPQDDLVCKTSSAPANGPRSQKKHPSNVKPQQKVTDEYEETIPQLVPIGETRDKENVKMEENITEGKSPKKRSDANTPRGKKRKVLPATETSEASRPGTSGKKLKIDVQELRKPGAKVFTPRKSVKKTSKTPKDKKTQGAKSN
ncbi:LOW QUALITY PROTEIN: ribosomal L1 domain-containing protein 1-like [Psammomys obesus]|uniref:LOW QUALITY PROTEIN: ribosomal L1 domain-containing protein 1-like n=1 Tax=Psammomys obesus TaxID=48139 RepID=UPI0024528BDB|nr:LOW QUALITY PROTEIN: ribosomal L1 domain-containing protein 1-like [Psammomys obesus]